MLVGYTEWPKEFADRYREEGCWLGETFGGVLRSGLRNMEIKSRL